MIQFFKNIRKGQLSEGKTGRYLKYALGEIVLVVIGILIALQINNWNNDRIDRLTACNYAENMMIDLNADLININGLIEFNDYYEQEGFHLLNILEHGNKISDTNRIKRALVISSYCPSANKSSSTYDELLYSGNILLFKDSDLKRQLDGYFIPNHWVENYNERIRKTMWDDYQGELISLIDPLIFRVIYETETGAYPTEETRSLEKLTELNDFKIDWQTIRTNTKLKNYLKRIQAHRIQLRNQFKLEKAKVTALINKIESIKCNTGA